MEMVPQCYPLFAAVRWNSQAPTLAVVIGWKLDDDDDAEPVLFEVGGTNLASVAEPGSIVYLGPDRSAAVGACRLNDPENAARATETAARRSPAVRYARGATALCGFLNAHEPHTWTPDDHEYPIACTGGTP